MSILLKTPFIHTLIGSLSKAQTDDLTSKLNGSGTLIDVKLWDTTELNKLKEGYGGTHTGVSYVNLEFLPGKKAKGFLIYTNSYLVLLEFDGSSQKLHVAEYSGGVGTNKSECLTIEELRRVIDDEAEHGADEWATTMKTKITYDSENNKIKATEKMDFEKNIEVHGNLHNVKSGEVHDWFIETNELKVNQIKPQDTPEGQRAAISVPNADLVVGASGDSRKILLNGGEVATLASVSGKEIKGKLTIGETEYTVALSTTDEGQAGYITFVIEQ